MNEQAGAPNEARGYFTTAKLIFLSSFSFKPREVKERPPKRHMKKPEGQKSQK